ncbi:MAG: helix-turn-helix domain-containing protein [Candidatus Omnitrophica bacterium]|nr:helix-turn-helix domain-containing protein [Candidatus Omnitrophota bacterium]
MYMKKYFLLEEVIKMLGVSRNTYYNWERSNKIPTAKRDPMSGYRIFTESDVNHLKKITGRG